MDVVEITTKVGCEVSCAYCPQEKFIRAYSRRSNVFQYDFDLFKMHLSKIPLDVAIIFCGMCEPFLNPNCVKMLLHSNEKGHKVAVETTLVGMNISDVDLIGSIPLMHFCVHLPSADNRENIKVDKIYLNLLGRVAKSKIRAYYKFHGNTVHPQVKALIKSNINWEPLTTRSGNLCDEREKLQIIHKGVIACKRHMRWNVLLPNGDVLLCSSDYGMQHILGNLTISDYYSLFKSEEFLNIANGMTDESVDILCRHCDSYLHKES